VRVKEYKVLDECVEKGINIGWHRAHKHTETPNEDQMKVEIHREVMNELAEYFIFADDEDEVYRGAAYQLFRGHKD
jgi:hypothetical protein